MFYIIKVFLMSFTIKTYMVSENANNHSTFVRQYTHIFAREMPLNEGPS